MPNGSALTTSRALDRTVPPHLDGQQHAEEQGGDEGREHQGEAGVGDDDVAPARAGPAVQLALPPQHPSGGVGRDDKRGGDDRRLDDKDRPPVEQLGQHAAESRADSNADGAGHRPPPPRPPLVTDDRAEHRQRPGQHERGPDALDGAGREEDRQARGHAGSQRSGSEHGDTAHDKHQRADPAVHQRHRHRSHRNDERVRRQHPRHANDRRVELGVQVGQSQGDDRSVSKRHPDRADQQHGAQPLPRTHGRAR